MTLAKIIRHPFTLIGQGFLLGGLMFVVLQDPRPANAAPTQAAGQR